MGKGETAFKKATAAVFYRLLSRLSPTPIPIDTGDFRLMTRRALDALQSMPEQARFIRGMVAWIGFKQVPLPYDRVERHAGTTKYPLAKMLAFAFDAVTGFSTAPLRFASHAGLWLVAAALLLLVYIAYGWLSGSAVEGWTIPRHIAVVGELSLAGEVRPVTQAAQRRTEGTRLGYRDVIDHRSGSLGGAVTDVRARSKGRPGDDVPDF